MAAHAARDARRRRAAAAGGGGARPRTAQPGGARHPLRVGRFTFVISGAVPARILTVSAALTLLGLVLLVVGSNLLAARRAARLLGRNKANVLPLRRELTRERPSGPLRVVVLIPAHNEQERLPAALDSLAAQTRPPDLIWVIADNCTDDTALVAERAGAQVFATVDNHDKKAGALNQLLARLLPAARPVDTFLVMDADTELAAPSCRSPSTGPESTRRWTPWAVCSSASRGPGPSASCSAASTSATAGTSPGARRGSSSSPARRRCSGQTRMRAVAAGARRYLPGDPGQGLRHGRADRGQRAHHRAQSLGADLISPQECRVQTELMPTWGDLWRQRQRWQRGALENIGTYGITSATSRYWMQQSAIGYGTVALWAFVSLRYHTLRPGSLVFPFWTAVERDLLARARDDRLACRLEGSRAGAPCCSWSSATTCSFRRST